jgi:hypothetical protein
MYILFILFLVSLIGIVIMLGRKLLLIQNGELEVMERHVPEVHHYFRDWARFLIDGLRNIGFALLVGTIRIYVRLTLLVRNQFKSLVEKINTIQAEDPYEKREVSKFLRLMGEYKKKLREIKKKVKREEEKYL